MSSVPGYLASSEHCRSQVDTVDEKDSHGNGQEENEERTTSCGSDDEMQQITVPEDCLKMDLTLQSMEDARHLLRTLRYWISNALPEELIMYSLSHRRVETTDLGDNEQPPFQAPGKSNQSADCSSVVGMLEEFITELTQLQPLVAVLKKSDRLNFKLVEAATQGSEPMLRCVREHAGGDDNDAADGWSAEVCSAAAAGGHLECLKYAHEHGCVWNADTCKAAAGRVTWSEVCT